MPQPVPAPIGLILPPARRTQAANAAHSIPNPSLLLSKRMYVDTTPPPLPLLSPFPFGILAFFFCIPSGRALQYLIPHSLAWRSRTLITNGELLRFHGIATMLSRFLPPLLPPPQSWCPEHMTQFFRMLPTLLERTDVFLNLRDARLPLTSVSSTQNAHSNQVRGIILLYMSSNSQTAL